MSTHAAEVKEGTRFRFGDNWASFLGSLNDRRVASAEQSVTTMLGDIRGKRFLDVGSGSGLFSLAAHRLGALVHSFDYDPQAVACTQELRRRYGMNSSQWVIEEGSALDAAYFQRLGRFEVVYSWGVLHHTGDMYGAFANIANCVTPGGRLFIAIYNDQGWKSRYWKWAKRLYNRGPIGRLAMTVVHLPLLLARIAVRTLTLRRDLERGMSLWWDYIDWLGGYPFEVASCEQVVQFFEQRGFVTKKVVSVGRRQGCNEFLFEAKK